MICPECQSGLIEVVETSGGDTLRRCMDCDFEFDLPPPAIRYSERCSEPALSGTFSGQRCGLTADETGLCWVHRARAEGKGSHLRTVQLKGDVL